jgi:hypothetical protein
VPSRQQRPDVAALADEEPPPALGGKAALFSVGQTSRVVRHQAAKSELAVEAPEDGAAESSPSEPEPRPHDAPERAPLTPLRLPVSEASRVQRSYVLGREHDQMVRRMAARLHLKIDQVVEEALDSLIAAHGLAVDLLQLGEVPVAAGPRPIDPIRRTVWLRSDQAEILRTCRLIFDVEASDLVRQAVEARFESYGFPR